MSLSMWNAVVCLRTRYSYRRCHCRSSRTISFVISMIRRYTWSTSSVGGLLGSDIDYVLHKLACVSDVHGRFGLDRPVEIRNRLDQVVCDPSGVIPEQCLQLRPSLGRVHFRGLDEFDQEVA